MEEQLWMAAECGRVKEVKRILRHNPDVDINWGWSQRVRYTPLHQACNGGHDKIVALLLAHPRIDVNRRSDSGETPLYWACFWGKLSCVQLMLRDPRVDPNAANVDGHTPLWQAVYGGFPDVIKWWIASGREMDLRELRTLQDDHFDFRSLGGAKKEVVSLLERIKGNQAQTRSEIREELGWLGEETKFFALVIFLSDGLLRIKEEAEHDLAGTGRFFMMAKRLPMELQMVLCCRLVGSMRMNIPGEESERGFRELVRKLLH